MKIAIVGTSRLTEKEKNQTRDAILKIIQSHSQGDVYLSGGAKGVDTEVRNIAQNNDIEIIEYKPLTGYWIDGFMPRNIKIAQECDILYCITTVKKDIPCYHCKDPAHEKTAGCWTMKQATKLKKETHLIII